MSPSAACSRRPLSIPIIIFISSASLLCSLASLSAFWSPLHRRTPARHVLHSEYGTPRWPRSSANSFPHRPDRPLNLRKSMSSSTPEAPQQAAEPYFAAQYDHRLRALATIDLSERLLSQQASVMLDEQWEPSVVDRLWNSLLGVGERERLDAASFKLARQGHPVPMNLASPWLAQRWPQIRASVKKWMQSRRVYDPGVLFTLLGSVKGPIDEFYMNLPLGAERYNYTAQVGEPYRSCAVVGNSGALLESHHGASIDAHEAVFRLNNARISGFERHVGSKTTLSFLNSNVLQACAGERRCFCQPYGEHVPTMVYITQPAHLMEVALCSDTQKGAAPLLVTDGRLDKLCARVAKYYSLKRFVEEHDEEAERPAEDVAERWSAARDGPLFHYSSGLEAVAVALGVCRRVSLFGFGTAAAQHHYHSSHQKSELHLHDYAAEYQLYRHLLQLSTISLSTNRSETLIPFLADCHFPFPPLHLYSNLAASPCL